MAATTLNIPRLVPTLHSQRPSSQYTQPSLLLLLQNQLSLPTWLAIGALLQLVLLALPVRRTYAALPTITFLAVRLLDTFLQSYNLRPNPAMTNVIPGLTTAHLPAASGEITSSAVGQGKICVVILSVRSNHPLGILAPRMKEMGQHFERLQKELEDKAAEYGFLGASSALATSDGRSSGNTLINIMYFRSAAHVHAFAHGAAHLETWGWWAEMRKAEAEARKSGKAGLGASDLISISHEVFEAEGGKWEALWENSAPIGLGAAVVDVRDKDENGEEEMRWGSPLVQAQGLMRSWKGRMGTVA